MEWQRRVVPWLQLEQVMDWARPNFKWSELWCKGCDGSCAFSRDNRPIANVADAALDKLQDLRLVLGAPITVLSAARCPVHNARVGGVVNSQHRCTENRAATAFDLTSHRASLEDIAKAAESVGFGGIGRYNSFIHVDDRGRRARWNGS